MKTFIRKKIIKEGSYYVVSANKASSVARQRKPEETYCNFANFKLAVGAKTDINQLPRNTEYDTRVPVEQLRETDMTQG